MKLTGKTVLVTGGSKGIGRACVEAFAREGCNVIINYAHDDAAAQELAGSVKKAGVKVLLVKADVSKRAEVEAMFVVIKNNFSRIDILVNNAGTAYSSELDGIEEFETVFATNLFGQVCVTDLARKMMSTGKIIFMSSIHGRLGHGDSGVLAYSASKAALESYTKNLAKALAPEILVNAIAPGRTLTPVWGEMSEKEQRHLGEGQLINRFIEPAEIAGGAVFLAKNDAICGEVLTIDGGMSLKTIG